MALASWLLSQAKGRFRRVNLPHLVALVVACLERLQNKTKMMPALPFDSACSQVEAANEPARTIT